MALQDAPLAHPAEVTSADAWRAGTKAGFVIELPSGKRARVKRSMNLLSMLEKGKIPNPLAGLVREMIATRNPNPDFQQSPEVIEQLIELVNKMTIRNFVEPRVEVQPDDWDDDEGDWEPSEGAIALDDVDLQDRMFAFAFAQGMASDLSQFRERQAQVMAGLSDGAAVEDPTGSTPAPGGPVPGVLPERGDLDVGQPLRDGDEPGGSGAGQASGEGGGTSAGSGSATEAPKRPVRNKRQAAKTTARKQASGSS